LERSDAVKDAMLNFYDRLSAGDVEHFDDIVSSDPATLVIGTAPGEWVTERERLRFGFEAEGYSIKPGDLVAWENGPVGFVADEPTLHFGDEALKARLTGVLQDEGGTWKLVHMHVSAGIPDEEVFELQKKWSSS
jgi:hypothetical protein